MLTADSSVELTRDSLLHAILSAKRLEDLQQQVRNVMVEHLLGKPQQAQASLLASTSPLSVNPLDNRPR